MKNVIDMLQEAKESLEYTRKQILKELQELQADFEDFSDEELVEHREVMRQRVDACLEWLQESEEENEAEF